MTSQAVVRPVGSSSGPAGRAALPPGETPHQDRHDSLPAAAVEPPREVPMLHEVWDAALAQGRCPVCAAGLPHIGSDCPEDPSRRIDTPPPVLPAASGLTLPRPPGRPWAPWEGFSGQQLP